MKGKESKHSTTDNHQISKKKSGKETKEQQNHQKTIYKMAILGPCLWIIVLDIKGLNFLIKI